jgi:hypothetical protein
MVQFESGYQKNISKKLKKTKNRRTEFDRVPTLVLFERLKNLRPIFKRIHKRLIMDQ